MALLSDVSQDDEVTATEDVESHGEHLVTAEPVILKVWRNIQCSAFGLQISWYVVTCMYQGNRDGYHEGFINTDIGPDAAQRY